LFLLHRRSCFLRKELKVDTVLIAVSRFRETKTIALQSSIVECNFLNCNTLCGSCGGTRPLRGQAPPSPPLSRAKGRAFSNKELKMGLFGRGRRTPQRGTSPLPGWFLCPPPVPASSSRWLPCWIFLESSTLKLHFVGVAAGLRFSQ